MDTNDARRIVLLSMIGTTGIVLASRAAHGKWPEPKMFVGAGFTYIVLGGLADVAPGVAAPGAALVFAGAAITQGGSVLDAISHSASAGPTNKAIDNPSEAFTLPGGIDPGNTFPGSPTGPSSSGPVTGPCANLPFSIAANPGIKIRKQFLPEVEALCKRFNVRVTSGFRTIEQQAATGSSAHHSDHLCGAAADFLGTQARMNALATWAIASKKYAVVVWRGKFYERGGATGPWSDHYDHVHISFERCGNAKGCS